MRFDLSRPIRYLITRGVTAEATTAASSEFSEILRQVSAAIAAGIELIQIREPRLTARVLFELAERSVELTRNSATRILVNDRADIAAAAGAGGVHLTTRSLDATIVRRTFGDNFLIGASTHSLDEARKARDGRADFAVFGPVFETESKLQYGPPLGLASLREAVNELAPFPLIALGGVSLEKSEACFDAGARGVAGISMFADPEKLKTVADRLRSFSPSPAA